MLALTLSFSSAARAESHPDFIETPPPVVETKPAVRARDDYRAELCRQALRDAGLLRTLKPEKPIENTKSKANKDKQLTSDEIRQAIQALEAKGYVINLKLFKKKDYTANSILKQALGIDLTMDDLYESMTRKYKNPINARRVLLEDPLEKQPVPEPAQSTIKSNTTAPDRQSPTAVTFQAREQLKEWIRKTTSYMLEQGVIPNAGGLLANSKKPAVQKFLGVVESQYQGSLFAALTDAGVDTRRVFQMTSAEISTPYSVPNLIKTMKNLPNPDALSKMLASEVPASNARLMDSLVRHLIQGDEPTVEEMAKTCMTELGEKVDGPRVMALLRFLATNRTLLNFLEKKKF